MQQLLEAEMEENLDCEKYERISDDINYEERNYRKDHSKKNVKRSF